MNKAFTREDDNTSLPDDDLDTSAPEIPAGSKNYITPAGADKIKRELHDLMYVERPDIVEKVSWAASLGDRSENADYHYNKKRLREIDRRIRFLGKRIENFEIVDPAKIKSDRVVFGATVEVVDQNDRKRVVKIVGIDEAKAELGNVSWVSPIGKALLQAQIGDVISLRTPRGVDELEVLSIKYLPIAID